MELLDGLKLHPQNNNYQHKPILVTWKGKKVPCSLDDEVALDYISRSDCSGFMNKLLCHSYNLTLEDLWQWMEVEGKRPLAKHYHNVIVNQKRFIQITKLEEVQPGDIIAIKYLKKEELDENKNEGDDNEEDGKPPTGHVMLVVESPKKRENPTEPPVPETVQWEVMVIDQSKSGHSKDDSRRIPKNSGIQDNYCKPNDSFYCGLGKGVIRIYTNKEGDIVGYTWSTFKNSAYHPINKRNLAVGRLDLKFSL